MRFGIRSLLSVTFALGFILHVTECLRGHSASKLLDVVLIFIVGSLSIVFFSVIGNSVADKSGGVAGSILGAIAWSLILWFVYTLDGELFRFIWVQAVMLVTTASLMISVVLRKDTDDRPKSESLDLLLKSQETRNMK